MNILYLEGSLKSNIYGPVWFESKQEKNGYFNIPIYFYLNLIMKDLQNYFNCLQSLLSNMPIFSEDTF